MHLLGSRNPWSFSHGFNMMVDFCIWVLEVDGLQVSPFDQHSEGDGSLRAVGLDALQWQSWLIRVVSLQYEQQQVNTKLVAEDPFNTQKRDPTSLFIPEVHNPPAAWAGSAAIGQRLVELWEQYGSVSNERRKWESKQARRWQKEERKGGKRLYDELRPYHTRIPTMIIHLVSYERPLNYLIAPVSVIMTATEDQPDADAAEFRERMLDAAAGLSANGSTQRQRKSNYTYSPLTSPRTPTPMYKIYPHKPVQSAPPRPTVHIVAESEVKQIILDSLEKGPWFGDEIKMETVRFLREKTIPGWQIHYVSFEEVDGEKHNMKCILKQYENGTWMLKSSSTFEDAREAVGKYFAPVHDHPLLFLSGGTSTDYTNEGARIYEFVAHGEIIDNGFDVTRVRLVNDVGQVFEDTVQDNLILFTGTQDREVQLPMKAELYNSKGVLVWRQTVLDNRPPVWWKFKAP